MLQTADYVRRFYPTWARFPSILRFCLQYLLEHSFGMMNGLIVANSRFRPSLHPSPRCCHLRHQLIYFNMPPNTASPSETEGRLHLPWLRFHRICSCHRHLRRPCSIIVWFVLNKTVFGKTYAVGGNPRLRRVPASISPRRGGLFGVCGFLFSLSGVLEAARTGSDQQL